MEIELQNKTLTVVLLCFYLRYLLQTLRIYMAAREVRGTSYSFLTSPHTHKHSDNYTQLSIQNIDCFLLSNTCLKIFINVSQKVTQSLIYFFLTQRLQFLFFSYAPTKAMRINNCKNFIEGIEISILEKDDLGNFSNFQVF